MKNRSFLKNIDSEIPKIRLEEFFGESDGFEYGCYTRSGLRLFEGVC